MTTPGDGGFLHGGALPYELQLLALADVHPSSRNAKNHTPAQIADIIRSIKSFGFRDPIAVDKDGVIVEGHGRVKALYAMGATHVPSLMFKDMTEDQVRAYRIAHNQTTLSTGFDIGALTVELRDLEVHGHDLTLTGFSLADLESFELQLEAASAPPPATSGGTGVPKDQLPEGAGVAGPAGPAPVTYQYVIVFDSKDQHEHWLSFIKYLKETVEGETIAERIDTFLDLALTEEAE